MVDDPPWLTLTEAAAASGLHRDLIRTRARRGLIASRKGNRGTTLVQLPAELMAMAGQDVATAGQGQADLVADLLAENGELREQLATAKAERDAALAVQLATVAAQADLVTELKAMLADARRPWWRRWL